MLSWFSPARFVVLSVVWCSVAVMHLKLLDSVVNRACFLIWGVFECDIAHLDLWQYCVSWIRSGVPDAPSLCCSTFTVCASAGYGRSSGCTSVYLRAYSLRNFAVPQDLYSIFSVPVVVLADPVLDIVGLTGFKSTANAFCWPKLLYPFFSSTNFPLLLFLSKVGIVRLESLDRLGIYHSLPDLHCRPLFKIIIMY